MVPVALAFALFQRGAGAGRVSAVLAAEALPMVVLMLLGSVLTDRLAPRRMMIAANLLRATAQAVLALLLLVGIARFGVILVLVSLVGIGTALDPPGRNRLLTQTVPPNLLPSANGTPMIATSLAGLLGPALGGLLVATTDAAWAIGIEALSYLTSAGLLLRIRPAPNARLKGGYPSIVTELKEGWSESTRRRWVWLMVCFFALLHVFSWAPLEVLGALLFADRPAGAPHGGGLLSMMGAWAARGRARPAISAKAAHPTGAAVAAALSARPVQPGGGAAILGTAPVLLPRRNGDGQRQRALGKRSLAGGSAGSAIPGARLMISAARSSCCRWAPRPRRRSAVIEGSLSRRVLVGEYLGRTS